MLKAHRFNAENVINRKISGVLSGRMFSFDLMVILWGFRKENFFKLI